MYLIVEENPNSLSDERVFSTSGEKRGVSKLNLPNPRTKATIWCDVTGVTENGHFEKAFAQRVEDSSDGTAWLVFGGSWGLRLRDGDNPSPWSLDNPDQWGLPFVVLDSSGTAIQFE